MAYYARVYYPADSDGDTVFAVPFPYIRQDHVRVFTKESDDAEYANELVLGEDFSWTSASTITLADPRANNIDLLIRRITPADDLLVRVQASLIQAAKINLENIHLLYLLQEALDEPSALDARLAEIIAAGEGSTDLLFGRVPIYPDFVGMPLRAVSSLTDMIEVKYWDAGVKKSRSGQRLRRASSEPSHPVKVQSLDGAWWEPVPGDIWVEQCGAVLDGATLDTTAINNAIKLQNSRGGGMVLQGEGTALLSNLNPLEANDFNWRAVWIPYWNIHYKGLGERVSKVKLAAGANCHVFELGQNAVTPIAVQNCSVEGVGIDGNRANQDAPLDLTKHWSGVSVSTGARNTRLQHLHIHDCQYYGIGYELSDFHDNYVADILIEDTGSDGFDGKDGYPGQALSGNNTGNVIERVTINRPALAALPGKENCGLDLRSGWTARNITVNQGTPYELGPAIRITSGQALDEEVAQPALLEDFLVVGSDKTSEISCGVICWGRYSVVRKGRSTGFKYGFSSRTYRQRVEAVECYGNLRGFNIWGNSNGVSQASDVDLIACISRNNDEYGVSVGRVENALSNVNLIGCDIRNNATGLSVVAGTLGVKMWGGSLKDNTTQLVDPDNSVKMWAVHGFDTRQTVVTTVDIASTGLKSLLVNHTLGFKPKPEDVTIKLRRNSNVGDWTCGFVELVDTSTTQVSFYIRVTGASATAGALATVHIEIDGKKG